MAELPFPRDGLDRLENIFDVFFLLFERLKEREGRVLSLDVLRHKDFDTYKKRIYRECQCLANNYQDFVDTGKLSADAKNKLRACLPEWFDQDALAGWYGALVGVDQAFPPPPRPPRQPLNRCFLERGHVRFLPGACLPYETPLIRGYAQTGTRIENKLQHLTVCFPQRNGYSAEMVPLSDHLLALFDDRTSPTFGIVPFRARQEKPTIAVTTRIPDAGAFFTVHTEDSEDTSAKLRAVLETACQHAIDILVFPELSFTSQLLGQLRAEFQGRGHHPKLVVAGTVLADRRNVCHVLGPDGRTLWQQAKMNRFVALPYDLPGAPDPIPEEGGTEDIDISERVIRIADFPFGRLAVLVCLDFILPETYSLLANMQVNCIIVPAMTPAAKRFDTLAWAHAAASHATTIFCNAPNCPGFQADARSFVYVPIRNQGALFIGEDEPWERYMLVFSAEPFRHETVPLSV